MILADQNESIRSTFAALLKARALERRPVILDGATGTELDNRGVDTASPAWSGLASLHAPEVLEAVHRDYVRAGADIVTANTFRTTERAFFSVDESGKTWEKAAREAVRIARCAAEGKALVAASIGPLADCFSPESALVGPAAEREHGLLAGVLAETAVDLILFETFGVQAELEAALKAWLMETKSSAIPFAVSLTTNKKGRLISGESLADAVSLAEGLGALAVLVNCIPVAHAGVALEELRATATRPTGIYANLGRAEPSQDWSGSAYLSPSEYADEASSWFGGGHMIIGGCCGSTPQHIRALVARLNRRN